MSSQEKRIKLGDVGQEETDRAKNEYCSKISVLSENASLKALYYINSHWSIRMIEFNFDYQSPVCKGTMTFSFKTLVDPSLWKLTQYQCALTCFFYQRNKKQRNDFFKTKEQKKTKERLFFLQREQKKPTFFRPFLNKGATCCVAC